MQIPTTHNIQPATIIKQKNKQKENPKDEAIRVPAMSGDTVGSLSVGRKQLAVGNNRS